jgi:hypothetical protein
MTLTDIYRVFQPARAQHTFSAVHGTFSKIDHILDHKKELQVNLFNELRYKNPQ